MQLMTGIFPPPSLPDKTKQATQLKKDRKGEREKIKE